MTKPGAGFVTSEVLLLHCSLGTVRGQRDALGGDSVVLVPQDVICHGTAALFYLSAAVLEAYMTYILGFQSLMQQQYRENIAAVVSAWQEGEVPPEQPQVPICVCTKAGEGQGHPSPSRTSLGTCPVPEQPRATQP